VLSFFKVRARKNILRIDSIAVKRGYRNLGIGKLLLAKVFKIAQSKGLKEVNLEVTDTNPNAKKLYEKLGFKVKKQVKFYFFSRSPRFGSLYVMYKKIK